MEKERKATIKIHKRRYVLRDDLDDYIMSNRTGAKIISIHRRSE